MTFNWVDRVSIELTTQMLATLLDVPFEDRRKLTRWSDMGTLNVESAMEAGIVQYETQWKDELLECLEYFTRLWDQKVNQPPRNDLISMLAHGEATRNMPPMEYLGNLMLLIVGGNDTTRNSISGGVLFLNQNPAEYDKLRANPKVIPHMVPEIIRYQTPIAHMRRTTAVDTELGGKRIAKGERVIMWYISGNRDEEAIERPDEFIIDRPNVRQHLAFRLRHPPLHGQSAGGDAAAHPVGGDTRAFLDGRGGDPVRVQSNFIHGFVELPVRVHRH